MLEVKRVLFIWHGDTVHLNRKTSIIAIALSAIRKITGHVALDHDKYIPIYDEISEAGDWYITQGNGVRADKLINGHAYYFCHFPKACTKCGCASFTV